MFSTDVLDGFLNTSPAAPVTSAFLILDLFLDDGDYQRMECSCPSQSVIFFVCPDKKNGLIASVRQFDHELGSHFTSFKWTSATYRRLLELRTNCVAFSSLLNQFIFIIYH